MKLRNNSSTIFQSFSHAFQGLWISVKTQRNVRIEIFFLLCVFVFGIVFQTTTLEKFISIFSSLFVIVTELINTSIEFLTDLVTDKKFNKQAKIVKDVAASAVLVSAIFAIVSNAIIFISYIRG